MRALSHVKLEFTVVYDLFTCIYGQGSALHVKMGIVPAQVFTGDVRFTVEQLRIAFVSKRAVLTACLNGTSYK